MVRKSHREPEAVEITTAPRSRGDEIAGRQRRYLLSMGFRTLCFVGAVAVGSGVLRWILVAGAVFLPYIAVVLANAGSSLDGGNPETYHPDGTRKELL